MTKTQSSAGREPCVLAIDHGTSGIKAAVVTPRGSIVDFEFESTPIHFIEGGGAEQNPDDWWNALVTATARLRARGIAAFDRIDAVCVSSTFSSTVAVDRDGNHLMNSLTWMDSRGAPNIRRAMAGFPSVMGYGAARAWKWLRRTGGAPSLSGKDDCAHVLLVRDEFPDVYARTHAFLPSKDYLNLRLTGRFAASYDSIQLFWITDTRDPNRIRYDRELIDTLGIDAEKLPELIHSTDVLGGLTPDAAGALGLRTDVRVVAGSPDHQCACVGSGAVGDYEGHLYIGTSSWIECMMPVRKTDAFHSIASFPTSFAGRYQCINEQDLAGGAVQFLADNILFHPALSQSRSAPENPYASIDELADGVGPGSGGVLFTPWLNGERTPVDDIHLRGGFHNISTTTDIRHMVRAVLEGVALNTRWSLGYVETFLGRRLDPIRIVGGGAQSRVWCRIFADVLGREILQVEEPLQANARGAALIAAVGLGWIEQHEISGLVGIKRSYAPRETCRDLYRDAFEEFLLVHRTSKRLSGRRRR